MQLDMKLYNALGCYMDYKSFSSDKLSLLLMFSLLAFLLTIWVKSNLPLYFAAALTLYYSPFIIRDFYNYKKRVKILEMYDLICPACLSGNFKEYRFCSNCGKDLKETIKFYVEPSSDLEITEFQLIEYKKNILGRRNRKIKRFGIDKMENIKTVNMRNSIFRYLRFDYDKKSSQGKLRHIKIDGCDEDEILNLLKTLKETLNPVKTYKNSEKVTNKRINQILEEKRKKQCRYDDYGDEI